MNEKTFESFATQIKKECREVERKSEATERERINAAQNKRKIQLIRSVANYLNHALMINNVNR